MIKIYIEFFNAFYTPGKADIAFALTQPLDDFYYTTIRDLCMVGY